MPRWRRLLTRSFIRFCRNSRSATPRHFCRFGTASQRSPKRSSRRACRPVADIRYTPRQTRCVRHGQLDVAQALGLSGPVVGIPAGPPTDQLRAIACLANPEFLRHQSFAHHGRGKNQFASAFRIQREVSSLIALSQGPWNTTFDSIKDECIWNGAFRVRVNDHSVNAVVDDGRLPCAARKYEGCTEERQATPTADRLEKLEFRSLHGRWLSSEVRLVGRRAKAYRTGEQSGVPARCCAGRTATALSDQEGGNLEAGHRALGQIEGERRR